jgi:hypothetical protein
VSLGDDSVRHGGVSREGAVDRRGHAMSEPPSAAAYILLGASSLAIAAWPASRWTVFACGTAGIGAAWSLSTLLIRAAASPRVLYGHSDTLTLFAIPEYIP